MDVDPFNHDYFGHTVLDPFGLGAIIVLGLAALIVPRRYSAVPIFVMACFVSPAQRVVVFSLNFDLLRIMVLAVSIRIVARGEWRGLRWTAMDLVLVAWSLVGTIAYVVLFGTLDALKYRLGGMYDAVGLYFSFRIFIRSWDDVKMIAITSIVLSVPVAIFFLVEHFTRYNVFGLMGGVALVTNVRDGLLRCQGAFAHPILAGCFWAALLPLMCAMWWVDSRRRYLPVIGFMSVGIIVYACSSSTPVLEIGLVVLGGCAFWARRWLGTVRLGVAGLLVVLQITMRSPVWHLFADLNVHGSSDGWHRYFVIQEAVSHFSDWWLMGTQSTFGWDGLYDITNQYVLEGCRGGIFTVCLFVAIIVIASRYLGHLLRRAGSDRRLLAIAWALGVSLFVHGTAFFSISYFGQILVVWYMHLAAIASLRAAAPAIATARRPKIKGQRETRTGRSNRERRLSPTGVIGASPAPRI